jgi:predicted PurR-regulated permease PerM
VTPSSDVGKPSPGGGSTRTGADETDTEHGGPGVAAQQDVTAAVREARAAASAAGRAERSADHAGTPAQQAERSAGEAEESARDAGAAAREADEAEDAARDAAREAELEAAAGELLIGDRARGLGMGRPGPPLQRAHPFLFGFFGALGALLAVGLWSALGQAKSVLVLLAVSMFLAVGLNPQVEWFIRRGVRRALAVGIVFLMVLAAFTGVGLAIAPVVTEQINALIDNAPGWLDLLTRSETLGELNDRYQFIEKAQSAISDPALAQRAFGGVLGATRVVANALFSAFTVLILTLYFLASLPAVKRAAYSLVPASRRSRVSLLGDEILTRVGGYVSGQFVVALTAGVSSFIFLQIVGLREFAVALAIVVVFTAFVPMVGGMIGVAVISLVGFADSLWIGIACLIYGIVYQQVENYVIYPRIMKRAVDIPGAVTVIAALIGGALLGVVGALLAVPTAAAILLIVREVWVRKADAS